ncbi:histidine kinase dimerization/phosphoacceptor domain -containing protein [Methanosarcina sp. MSH10X1]|uniref:histidine kinase dimerization/phosphoacceptor domain -containing protein n=1 Tax=Methanosarcina sp. MSH10X1 TaxID=2507075 RepID=UPI001F0BF600|nr:histidine kinase dimerization/phosphoacceptor domain -containing protein [Methanosarcina sp. MSH10X1]
MEKFVIHSPDPLLRIGKDGRVIYSNETAELFLQEWGITTGEKVPYSIGNIVKRVIARNNPEKTEIKLRKRVYLISFYPLEGEGQVNVYGFDVTNHKKLKEKLLVKERQSDALHNMGRMALRCESLQAFMDESVKLVARTLGVEYSKIMELLPDGNFLLRAGAGWKPGFVGKAIVSGSKEYQAGYTTYSKVPVIVRDFKKEERFSAPSLLREHDVASGISVVIGQMEKPFGILSAHSKKPRKFVADDTYFLNSVAFLISEVIERRHAEEELRQYKEQLEELVKKRTSELIRTNERLIEEIAGRKQVEKALQNNVYFLETFLDAIPSPVFYRNLVGIYQGCNEIFAREVLGLPKEKVIGHSMFEFREQFSDETLKDSTFYDRMLLEEGRSIPHELKVRCAIDGKERDFLAHKATYSSVSGDIIGIVGVMLDITERKKAELALLKTEEIRKKEIHHRIKNNLQVISSLLSLQAEHFSDREVRESFQDSQNRVISMSLIHEELYKTGETGNFETFDFKAYIQKLANELFTSYVVGNQDIHLKLDLESVFLGMDTGIPLGIIINELVSNSLKHAFPGGRGEIQIRLHRIGSGKVECEDKNTGRCETYKFLLAVSDNGIGLSGKIDFRHTSSLGLQLVNILVEQIDGSIELVRGAGTEFKIKFRENA